MMNWLNSEIVLKFMNWIETIFSFFKTKSNSKHRKISKHKIKDKMEEARIASIEGNEDKVNMMVDNIHRNRIIDEKIEEKK